MSSCPIYDKIESDKMVRQMMIRLENDNFFKKRVENTFGGIGLVSIISQILVVSNQISKVPNNSLFTVSKKKDVIEQIRVSRGFDRTIDASIEMKEIFRVLNYQTYKEKLDCVPIFEKGNFKWLHKLLLNFPWILFIIIAYFISNTNILKRKKDAHTILKALVEFNEIVANDQDYDKEKETFIRFANENNILMLTTQTNTNNSIINPRQIDDYENIYDTVTPKVNWTRSNNDSKGYGRYTRSKGGRKSRRRRKKKIFF
jgi:hypothetical protein